MSRPPRPPTESVIRPRMLLRAWAVMGTVSAVLVLAAFFAVLLPAGWAPGADVSAGAPLHQRYVEATTVSFLAIVACQVGTAIASRCDRASLRAVGIWSNPLLLWGIGAELAFALAVVYLPPLQHVFGTGAVTPAHLAILLPCPLLVWGSDELYRWAGRRRTPAPTAGNAATGPTPVDGYGGIRDDQSSPGRREGSRPAPSTATGQAGHSEPGRGDHVGAESVRGR